MILWDGVGEMGQPWTPEERLCRAACPGERECACPCHGVATRVLALLRERFGSDVIG